MLYKNSQRILVRVITKYDLPNTPIVATGVAIGPFGSNNSIRSSKNSASGESSSASSSSTTRK